MQWREHQGVSWLQADLPGARAAFTARAGGVSEDPFASLNCGIATGDDREAVLENRRRAALAPGIEPADVLSAHQVHGADVQWHDASQQPSHWLEPGPGPNRRKADGQATAAPGLAPAVLVADCLPVALTGPGGVAMLHCGWRGLAAGIVARGAERVGARAAAIGPGIGPCCYEVGPEVLDRFADLGEGIAAGSRLDLAEVARQKLAAAGVGEIESAGLCTSCEPQLFFSHRRDGERSGRQAGLTWLREGG